MGTSTALRREPTEANMSVLSVWCHEGQIDHELDGHEFLFRETKVYVNANTTVVYGRQWGEVMWEFDEINIIYVTDIDGEDLNLTPDEEKELAKVIAYELSNDSNIEEKVHEDHSETLYWERRA
jgi:2',3'-cyclic-nucleotide 2'-phosphodiesterase (5'-nucleotidase family)